MQWWDNKTIKTTWIFTYHHYSKNSAHYSHNNHHLVIPLENMKQKKQNFSIFTFIFFHQYFRFNFPACCSNWAALCCNLSLKKNKYLRVIPFFFCWWNIPARSSRSDKFLSRSNTLSTFCRIISTTSSTCACCCARRLLPPPPPAGGAPGPFADLFNKKI